MRKRLRLDVLDAAASLSTARHGGAQGVIQQL